MNWEIKPDGYLPDGTPLYICARGSAKSSLQLEWYRKLLGISDREWGAMKREAGYTVGFYW